MMELCPSGPLYLELGNGIQAVLKRLSTQSRARTSSIEKLVLRGRYCRFIDSHVSGEEIHDVLRMASCLPNLKRLSLLRLRVPITAIAQTLQLGQQQQANHNNNNNQQQDGSTTSSATANGTTGGGFIKELELRSICYGSIHDFPPREILKKESRGELGTATNSLYGSLMTTNKTSQ